MDSFKGNFGIYGIFILAIAPLIIWIFMQPLSTRFINFNTTFTSLGQISALLGLILFSLSFVLSSKLKVLEEIFRGLDKVYKIHHLAGTIAFILLLFHPLFLAAKYIEFSLRQAALFLLPSANLSINFGIAALFLMEIFLIITFFIKIKYNKWLFTHKLLGVAYILAGIHVYSISSDISRSLLLRIYILGIFFIGLVFYFYKTILGKKIIKKYIYKVSEVKKINRNVFEITLSSEKEKINFIPGQFIFISFQVKGKMKEVHPFTISSAPSEDNIRLSIKNLGDYTSELTNLKKGTLAKIEGPYGKFSYKNHISKEQIWIAGGIGITPFLSMARSLRDKEHRLIELYYSVVNKEDAVFLDELLHISKKDNNFKVIPSFSSKEGFLNAKLINEKSKNILDKEIFICGPLLMMKSLRKQFINIGIKNKNIHSEEFNLL